jgi:hypothetical protein
LTTALAGVRVEWSATGGIMDRTIPDRYVEQIAAIRELNHQASAALKAGDLDGFDRLRAEAQDEAHGLVTEMSGYYAAVPV